MARHWRPRSVFICTHCHVWRVRVMNPRCHCGGSSRLCEKVPAASMNDQMRRHLEKANSRERWDCGRKAPNVNVTAGGNRP